MASESKRGKDSSTKLIQTNSFSPHDIESGIDCNDAELSQAVITVSGNLVISVSDNGAGISEGNQKKIFKEIVQFRPEVLQSGGGSGLGMWISKSIMDCRVANDLNLIVELIGDTILID
jgi:signal transduction histidine kinase